MIASGDTFAICVRGQDFDAKVLRRSEQRKLVAMLQQLESLEGSVDALQSVFDIVDKVGAMCLPTLSDEELDGLTTDFVLEIAGETIARQLLGVEDKKKFESPPSSAPGRLPDVAEPDVFVTSDSL